MFKMVTTNTLRLNESPQSLKRKMKKCCSELRKTCLSCVSLICVGCDGRVIYIETVYVAYHMILDLHTCNTRRQLHTRLSDLQTQPGLPL
jgi:hypothetical protein